jgi:hypothetical protein
MLGLLTWTHTIANRGKDMKLTRVERERITDSQMKIQAVASSLRRVDPRKVVGLESIHECLEGADRSLGAALRSSRSHP